MNFKTELNKIFKERDGLTEKGRKLFLRFLKDEGITDLVITKSNEYDDNNYYDWVRPTSLYGVEFDIYQINEVDPIDFVDLCADIKTKKLGHLDAEQIMEKLGHTDAFDPLSDLVELAKAIVKKGVDPSKTLEVIAYIGEFPTEMIPENLITYG